MLNGRGLWNETKRRAMCHRTRERVWPSCVIYDAIAENRRREETNLDFRSGSAGHELGDLAQIDASCQVHFSRVNLQNVQTGLFVWRWELDLSINATRSQQSRIQNVDTIRCHDHLKTKTRGKSDF